MKSLDHRTISSISRDIPNPRTSHPQSYRLQASRCEATQ